MKRLCVFCGSNTGKHPEYLAAGKELAALLAKQEITLVYGGASVGIMGAIADTMLSNGGKVIGVIPESIANKEVAHTGLTELRVVSSMHERKAIMANISDGFIALPGGFGTLEELFEIVTWSQLGFIEKPCGLLNIKSYYDNLIAFLDQSVDAQFVKPIHRNILLTHTIPDRLLEMMYNYKPPQTDKWFHTNS